MATIKTPIRRRHHTGEIYLNGKSMYEADSLSKVYDPKRVVNPIMITTKTDYVGDTYSWYCESDDRQTTIYANFHEHDPNRELVEINVRESCFYPSEPERNYFTVSGFHISQAATQWAAPTAEQPGPVGTHWSKGWNKENIGSHIVRNNTIYNCGVAGICGSLGAAFSQITNNHIYDHAPDPMQVDGNIYLHGALHFEGEKNYVERTDLNPGIQLIEEDSQVVLLMTIENFSKNYKNKFVTTALLDKVKIPDCVYENPDGTPVKIDTDYFGHKRNESDPSAGPCEHIRSGKIKLAVW